MDGVVRPPAWPVRSGVAPPRADGFTPRPETAADVMTVLTPGLLVIDARAGRAARLGHLGTERRQYRERRAHD